ncbi:hypothetical protein AnigIFM63604_004787 [Aspergillus niger]|uniref:Uncharacterized protein n=1 Tax=Aspergillus niger TaxID=5061 RepID=A0A9W6AGD0_ASPNG|nr:hypothetical protein AnigIFM63604_004787 [Aspergillus niger]
MHGERDRPKAGTVVCAVQRTTHGMAQCLPVEEEGNGQDRTGPTESPFLLLRNGRLRKVGSWSPHRNPDACPATFIEPGGNTTQHQHASELTDERDLSLTAPKSEGDDESTIDLSLATPRLQDSLIRCLPRDNLDHDSDRIPLETVLAIPTRERTFPEKWNWEFTDQERLHRVRVQTCQT